MRPGTGKVWGTRAGTAALVGISGGISPWEGLGGAAVQCLGDLVSWTKWGLISGWTRCSQRFFFQANSTRILWSEGSAGAGGGRELLLSMEGSHPFPHLSPGQGASPTLGVHRGLGRVSNQIQSSVCVPQLGQELQDGLRSPPKAVLASGSKKIGKKMFVNVGHISRHKEKAPPVLHILGGPAEPWPVLPLGCAGALLASRWREGRISQLQENFRGPCSHNEYT